MPAPRPLVVRLVCSLAKQVFFDILEHLNRMLGSSLIANFLLTMNGPRRVITCFRGSPKETARSYPILRIGRALSLDAPLLPVAMYSSCSFLFFLFFYDQTMKGTTTQGQRPPRQRHVDHTTNHPTNQQRRATHDMTQHHTTKTRRHTRTRTCTCTCTCICNVGVHVHVGVIFCSFLTKKRSLEHVPSMMCTVPSL